MPEPLSRAHASSSGPIDLAARLGGAPIAIAIKPPLPEPIPVPPDQIPVAPESGLVIRKRTASAGPITTQRVPVAGGPAASTHGVSAQTAPAIATPGPVIIKPRAATSKDSAPPPVMADRSAAPDAPDAMPSISLDGLAGLGDDRGELELELASSRAAPAALVMPALEDTMGDLALPPTPPARPHVTPTASPAVSSDRTPAALRGNLRYAVVRAELTSAGIRAHRDDGSDKLVEWDAIVGIIARRLPSESPYEGIPFVDLVSVAGSTLRFLPWTQITGAPIHGDGEERCRALVQLVAAHCLDAKLDSWTKVFADGTGHAAQLPSLKMLAAHDDRLA